MTTMDQATALPLAITAVKDGREVEVVDSFEAMALSEPLLRGVFAYGFEKPSAIQQRAIVPMIKARDPRCAALPRAARPVARGSRQGRRRRWL